MTSQQLNLLKPENIIMQAVKLANNASPIKREAIHFDNTTIHIWGYPEGFTLILLQKGKKFIGVQRREGCYEQIVSHYQLKHQQQTVH